MKFGSFFFTILAVVSFSSLSLANERSFTLAIDSRATPLTWGESKSARGIIVDLIVELVEKRMGIPVQFYAYPWARAQSLVENGTHDGMVTNAVPKRLKYAIASKNVIHTAYLRPLVKSGTALGHALLNNPSIDIFRSHKFCHSRGSGWHKFFLKANSLKGYEVKDSLTCATMISKGRMDTTVYAEDMLLWDLKQGKLGEELEIIKSSFGQWNLKLLVSQKSKFTDTFLIEFDDLVTRLKIDGTYKTLVEKIQTKYK